MVSNYLKFSELFSRLSPYELNHFSEVLLCKLELAAEGIIGGSTPNKALTEQELKFALVETMRDIVVQLNKREICERQIKLSHTLSQIFASENIAA